MYKISVDLGKCIGCGSCAELCPKSFEIKDGKAHPKSSEIKELSCEKDAEESCPADAISVKEI